MRIVFDDRAVALHPVEIPEHQIDGAAEIVVALAGSDCRVGEPDGRLLRKGPPPAFRTDGQRELQVLVDLFDDAGGA